MLCEVCVWMLRARRGRTFGGTLGLHFVHHDSAESFRKSVARDCSICHVLGDEVRANFLKSHPLPLARDLSLFNVLSRADLSVVSSSSDGPVSVYRLDFSVELAGTQIRHTFVLRPAGFSGCSRPKHPFQAWICKQLTVVNARKYRIAIENTGVRPYGSC